MNTRYFGVLPIVFILAGCNRPQTGPSANTDTAVAVAIAARDKFDAAQSSKTIAFWEAQTKRDPQGALGWNFLAGAYLQRGRESGDIRDSLRAEAAARRSLKLLPQNTSALLRLGRALMAQHKFSDVLSIANRAVKSDPQAHRLRADVLLELGRYSEASASIVRVPVQAHDVNAMALRARWFELQGQSGSALKLWQQTTQEVAHQPDISHEGAAWFWIQLGNCLARRGSRAEAEKSYRNALAIFPSDYRARAALARLAARQS
jgi:tetratricopeptide (TPR) repeat protein